MDSPLKVLYMNGYSGCWVDADYGSVSQKWLLIHSGVFQDSCRAKLF